MILSKEGPGYLTQPIRVYTVGAQPLASTSYPTLSYSTGCGSGPEVPLSGTSFPAIYSGVLSGAFLLAVLHVLTTDVLMIYHVTFRTCILEILYCI